MGNKGYVCTELRFVQTKLIQYHLRNRHRGYFILQCFSCLVELMNHALFLSNKVTFLLVLHGLKSS